MKLSDLLVSIRPADRSAYDCAVAQYNSVAKPLGSLGCLEDLIARIAAASGSSDVRLDKKCVLVFCADNGVVRRGVTQTGSDVTAAIARMLAHGQASVCSMARVAGADVFPVDMGMYELVEGLINRRISAGTSDISEGPAMTRSEAERAILAGAELVKEKKERGYTIIATGEAGIGNTTTSSAVAAALLGCEPETVTGRGAGLSDAGLARKREAVRRALAVNRPDAGDPVDVLRSVGGFDIAALTGAFLGGAAYHVPVVIDGVISSVAALCAARLCPDTRGYMLPSHLSAEPAGQLIMDELGLTPVIRAGMRLGEGTGAVALFPLLDMAAAVYRSGVTFDTISIPAYTKQS